MIAWRCNALRTETFLELEGVDPSSLSYTYTNKLYPIYQNQGDIIFNVSYKTSLEAASAIEASIGDELYWLYSTPLGIAKNPYLDWAIECIPSVRLNYPQFFTDALDNNNDSYYIIIYIPGLSRVLETAVSRTGVGFANTTFYRVHDNKCTNIGALTHSGEGVNMCQLYSNEERFQFSFFNGDFNPDTINDTSKYGRLFLGVREDNNKRVYTVGYFTSSYSSKMKEFYQFLIGDYSPPDFNPDAPPNPYEPGGDSGEGGGDGTFDDKSDQIGDSTLPTISSANTGFTRIYNPTLSQVQALAQYLWTDESVIQTIWNHIKQYFENPMEAMIGFNLVPVTVPDGGTTTFKLMYIDTGVSMTAAASQFVDTDCGTLKLDQYYGSALDYSPYTKVSIFLPYIGMVSVDTDEVMGRTLQIKYRTDICSGACVAKILVDGNVLYQYTGHCAINIPFSAADFSSYVSAVMSTAKLAGTLALGASGALGPVAVSEITQQTGEAITKTVNTERNPETGRQITSSSQTQTRGPSEITTTRASYAGISPSNVTNTVGEVISSKPHVEHSGSFSGTSGYLGIRRPYVIIKRPNMCMPSNYQSLNGFPCMITLKLGDCKGFTRVQQVVLSKMGKATNPEQAEILGLLKNGVIL